MHGSRLFPAALALAGVLLLASFQVSALGDSAKQLQRTSTTSPVSAPIPDFAAVNAVSKSHSSDFGAALTATGTLYTVPPGKRLVIETISGMATCATTVFPHGSIATRLGASSTTTHVVFELVGATSSMRRYAFNHPVRVYADAETNVTFTMLRSNSDDQGGYNIGFSGYLIDSPVPRRRE